MTILSCNEGIVTLLSRFNTVENPQWINAELRKKYECLIPRNPYNEFDVLSTICYGGMVCVEITGSLQS